MSESGRIWDLFQRSYEGNAWHGPALKELLESVDAGHASARPVAGGRTIWEITDHLSACEDVVRRRLLGDAVDETPPERSWPAVKDTSIGAWRRSRQRFEERHQALRDALWGFPESRLDDVVPGRDYPFYLMLYGLSQHELYHAGQIVVLMQAQGLTPVG